MDDACLAFSFVAVAKILGEGAADLPGFKAAYADDPRDNYLAGLSWQICFNHALPPFLALTDPQGLTRT